MNNGAGVLMDAELSNVAQSDKVVVESHDHLRPEAKWLINNDADDSDDLYLYMFVTL